MEEESVRLQKFLDETATRFVLEYALPIAKCLVTDLLEDAALEIAEVFTDRSFPQKRWESRL